MQTDHAAIADGLRQWLQRAKALQEQNCHVSYSTKHDDFQYEVMMLSAAPGVIALVEALLNMYNEAEAGWTGPDHALGGHHKLMMRTLLEAAAALAKETTC